MSPPATSSKKGGRGGSAAGKKGAKGSSSSGRGTGKRSASAALAEDDYSGGSKRAKRSTSGRKSLREEELGVGAELEDDIEAEGGEEEGEEDEDEDGDGGVTRCVCGQDNEEMASCLMIQCDTCKCWQHGACVGLWDEKECPNRYFCELCKPSLHGPGGLLRKVSRKSSAPAAGRSGSPTSTRDASGKGHKPRESADAAMVHAFLHDHNADHKPASTAFPSSNSSAPKKRNTMNSRDAAYDDAIALSILEHGTAAMRAKLEKARNGELSGSEEESGEEEDEVEEIIISGAGGRGKGKKPAGAKPSAKGRVVVTGKKGAKGKSGPRNRRSPSNAEDESPAPDGDDEDSELKEEAVDADDGELAGQGHDADEEAGGMEAERDDAKRRQSVSEERGDEHEHDEEKAKEDAEHDAGESSMALDEKADEEVAEAEASPEPSPVPVHTGGRGKHPNQYTYRGRGGHGAHGRGGKSPIKRGGALHTSFSSHGNGEASGSSGKNGTGAATSSGAFGWGLPEHLRHLAPLLPSQSPQLLEVPSVADPTAPPALEPPTKVRFPGKRVTMPEMRKRARTVLDFVTKVQVEMSERDKRWEVLRDANERIKEAREKERSEKAGSSSGGASTSGSAGGSGSRSSSAIGTPRGVGGTTPVPSSSTAVDFTLAALPPLPGASSAPLLTSAASPQSLAMMDRLAKEVIRFQERFFGVVE